MTHDDLMMMMISRRLLNISWSFLCLGVCLSCLSGRGYSETSPEDEWLNEILSSLQNNT